MIRDGSVSRSPFADRLGKMALVPESFSNSPQAVSDVEHEGSAVFEALYRIFMYKGQLYGNHRLKLPDLPADYASKMLFADMERKFGRFKRFVWEVRPGEDTHDIQMETLGDLVIHSVIAMIALEAKRERIDNGD